jgi:ferric-dicitrate binding protein FerR (iron transport regulator)
MESPIPEHLIIRYLSREATSSEQEALFDWVAADERHQQLFHEWVAAWEQKLPYNKAFHLSPALEKLNRRIDAYDQALTEPSEARTISLTWWKLAASLALFITAGLGIYFYAFHSASQLREVAYSVSRTTGEQQAVTLADGTVVTLNTNSLLRYPTAFAGATREVYLEGEAFFSVARDEAHPFMIHTGALTTQVLGTSFNVRSLANTITVSVATGKVQVRHGSQAHILLPDDQLVYDIHHHTAREGKADLVQALAWMQRVLVFEDLSLEEAAKKLQAAYGVRVVLENAALRRCVITGRYTNQPLEKVLKAIAYSIGIQYTLRDNIVTLTGKGCE